MPTALSLLRILRIMVTIKVLVLMVMFTCPALAGESNEKGGDAYACML